MNRKRSAVRINLEFAGAVLPVEINEQGQHVVPLKPICDAIGLEWERQRKKVSEPYLSKRLGSCTVQMLWAEKHREMICIRLDRVAAYLNTVNPESVRGQGNESAADFLEAKHAEWDDLIDAYERGFGILAKGSKATAKKQPDVRDFLSVLRAEKQTDSEPERKVLHLLARKIASDLGAPFEEEATNAS
jgi:hypothetical protein